MKVDGVWARLVSVMRYYFALKILLLRYRLLHVGQRMSGVFAKYPLPLQSATYTRTLNRRKTMDALSIILYNVGSVILAFTWVLTWMLRRALSEAGTGAEGCLLVMVSLLGYGLALSCYVVGVSI